MFAVQQPPHVERERDPRQADRAADVASRTRSRSGDAAHAIGGVVGVAEELDEPRVRGAGEHLRAAGRAQQRPDRHLVAGLVGVDVERVAHAQRAARPGEVGERVGIVLADHADARADAAVDVGDRPQRRPVLRDLGDGPADAASSASEASSATPSRRGRREARGPLRRATPPPPRQPQRDDRRGRASAACCGASSTPATGAVASRTQSPPTRLAWYCATSAARRSSAGFQSRPALRAAPQENVTPASLAAGAAAGAAAKPAACSSVAPGMITQNSSPPRRAGMMPSSPVTAARSASAVARSAESPASWPSRSLIALSPSRSPSSSATGSPRAASASRRSSAARRFGRPRQVVLERQLGEAGEELGAAEREPDLAADACM